VNQLQNGATEALQEIVGNYYSPYQLRKVSMYQVSKDCVASCKHCEQDKTDVEVLMVKYILGIKFQVEKSNF
jgi:hypothetical protein